MDTAAKISLRTLLVTSLFALGTFSAESAAKLTENPINGGKAIAYAEDFSSTKSGTFAGMPKLTLSGKDKQSYPEKTSSSPQDDLPKPRSSSFYLDAIKSGPRDRRGRRFPIPTVPKNTDRIKRSAADELGSFTSNPAKPQTGTGFINDSFLGWLGQIKDVFKDVRSSALKPEKKKQILDDLLREAKTISQSEDGPSPGQANKTPNPNAKPPKNNRHSHVLATWTHNSSILEIPRGPRLGARSTIPTAVSQLSTASHEANDTESTSTSDSTTVDTLPDWRRVLWALFNGDPTRNGPAPSQEEIWALLQRRVNSAAQGRSKRSPNVGLVPYIYSLAKDLHQDLSSPPNETQIGRNLDRVLYHDLMTKNLAIKYISSLLGPLIVPEVPDKIFMKGKNSKDVYQRSTDANDENTGAPADSIVKPLAKRDVEEQQKFMTGSSMNLALYKHFPFWLQTVIDIFNYLNVTDLPTLSEYDASKSYLNYLSSVSKKTDEPNSDDDAEINFLPSEMVKFINETAENHGISGERVPITYGSLSFINLYKGIVDAFNREFSGHQQAPGVVLNKEKPSKTQTQKTTLLKSASKDIMSSLHKRSDGSDLPPISPDEQAKHSSLDYSTITKGLDMLGGKPAKMPRHEIMAVLKEQVKKISPTIEALPESDKAKVDKTLKSLISEIKEKPSTMTPSSSVKSFVSSLLKMSQATLPETQISLRSAPRNKRDTEKDESNMHQEASLNSPKDDTLNLDEQREENKFKDVIGSIRSPGVFNMLTDVASRIVQRLLTDDKSLPEMTYGKFLVELMKNIDEFESSPLPDKEVESEKPIDSLKKGLSGFDKKSNHEIHIGSNMKSIGKEFGSFRLVKRSRDLTPVVVVSDESSVDQSKNAGEAGSQVSGNESGQVNNSQEPPPHPFFPNGRPNYLSDERVVLRMGPAFRQSPGQTTPPVKMTKPVNIVTVPTHASPAPSPVKSVLPKTPTPPGGKKNIIQVA